MNGKLKTTIRFCSNVKRDCFYAEWNTIMTIQKNKPVYNIYIYIVEYYLNSINVAIIVEQ